VKAKHKQPSVLSEPKPEKKPISIFQDSGSLKVAWRFRLLELCDPFGWHEINEETLRYIHGKLSHYETMTVNEIFANKKYNHSVPIKDLCKPAQERLWALNLEDFEQIHRLRLSGTERVWGIRELNVLSLLWWDPEHQICPSAER
jgi:hypothetical protein